MKVTDNKIRNSFQNVSEDMRRMREYIEMLEKRVIFLEDSLIKEGMKRVQH